MNVGTLDVKAPALLPTNVLRVPQSGVQAGMGGVDVARGLVGSANELRATGGRDLWTSLAVNFAQRQIAP
jgi:hypothetical protein